MWWPTGDTWLTDLMAVAMIACAVVVSGLLQHFDFAAEYGRYEQRLFTAVSTVSLPAKVAWFVQELPSFAIPVYFIVSGRCDRMWHVGNALILWMFIMHYAQRTFLYSLLIRGGKGTPAHVFLLASVFTCYNGYMQSAHHCHSAVAYSDVHFWSAGTIAGVALFFAGMAINLHADHVLRNLRKEGESGYKMPTGGLFAYVSCANYLGEMVEWAGWAMVARTLPAVAFAFFTVANLTPRAMQHHRWYRRKFEDYPRERRAVLPFLL